MGDPQMVEVESLSAADGRRRRRKAQPVQHHIHEVAGIVREHSSSSIVIAHA
jgi:hypothetical protein